jgi:hypothetical protein
MPSESGLIEYTMRLREALHGLGDPLPTDAASEAADEETEHSQSLVAITGAFLTGVPLRVRIADYERVQESLRVEFARGADDGWSVYDENWHQHGSYFSGGGFASKLPLVIARRGGEDARARVASILREREDADGSYFASHADGWRLTPTEVRVDVYDLGVAVMNGTLTVDMPLDISLEAQARVMKQLVWLRPDQRNGVSSPVTSTFRILAHESMRQFESAVAHAVPDARERPWLAPFLEAVSDEATATLEHDWGRVLWLHPVHIAQVDDDSAIDDNARRLAPPFHRTIDIPSGRFVAGIGWSAIVGRRDVTDVETPLRLLELHWAYIALFMEIDRGLLAVLDASDVSSAQTLHELEDAADHVFSDYMRVAHARARVDSELASLGGDEQAIWDVLCDVTRFDALVEGVDRKVAVLQQLAERRVQQAAAAQSRRTSAILSFLTALTVVTVTIALIGSFIGNRSDALGHLSLRVAIIAAALLASVGLYREAFRDRLAAGHRRTRRRFRRHRRRRGASVEVHTHVST